MAITCPVGFDVERLRAQVLATYERVARDPGDEFHFHRGARYAADYLRYDPVELAQLPDASTSRFAGVGNPLRIGPIQRGETVPTMPVAAAWTCCWLRAASARKDTSSAWT